MFAFARTVALKDKLSHDGLIELDAALDAAGHPWSVRTSPCAGDVCGRDRDRRFQAHYHRWVAGMLIAQAGVIIGTVFAMMTFLVSALKP